MPTTGALSIKLGPPAAEPLTEGLHWPLGEGFALFVPSELPPDPVAMVVFLHGAMSNPRDALSVMQLEAQERKFLLLMPKSVGSSWDAIHGEFGPDVVAMDASLAYVFTHFDVDPDRLAIAGFSDGASYALSLGLVNGDLFSHVLAFSPGCIVSERREGRPDIFVSHGTTDAVLSIDKCSRGLVAGLRAEGYDVDYHEFPGGHEPAADMVTAALTRVLG
jgi:phospholipase/carboxylesterase